MRGGLLTRFVYGTSIFAFPYVRLKGFVSVRQIRCWLNPVFAQPKTLRFDSVALVVRSPTMTKNVTHR